MNELSETFAKLALLEVSPIALHSLPSCPCDLLLAEGSDLRSVAAILGHSSASVTLNVCGHVVAVAKSRAIERIGNTVVKAQARQAAGENYSG